MGNYPKSEKAIINRKIYNKKYQQENPDKYRIHSQKYYECNSFKKCRTMVKYSIRHGHKARRSTLLKYGLNPDGSDSNEYINHTHNEP